MAKTPDYRNQSMGVRMAGVLAGIALTLIQGCAKHLSDNDKDGLARELGRVTGDFAKLYAMSAPAMRDRAFAPFNQNLDNTLAGPVSGRARFSGTVSGYVNRDEFGVSDGLLSVNVKIKFEDYRFNNVEGKRSMTIQGDLAVTGQMKLYGVGVLTTTLTLTGPLKVTEIEGSSSEDAAQVDLTNKWPQTSVDGTVEGKPVTIRIY